MIKLSIKDVITYCLILIVFVFSLVTYLQTKALINAAGMVIQVRQNATDLQTLNNNLQNITREITNMKLQKAIDDKNK